MSHQLTWFLDCSLSVLLYRKFEGKDIWQATIDALQTWYGLPREELEAVHKLVHYFHIHSLMLETNSFMYK
jgi:hypothetical protein